MLKRRLKDKDAAEPAFKLLTFTWALGIGILGGGVGGAGLIWLSGGNPYVGAAVGAPMTGAAIYILSRFFVARVAAAVKSMHVPSGNSTPEKREYSYAASRVAHGHYGDAVAQYRRHCMEHPEDPEPYFQLARVLRDHLDAHEEAIDVLRQSLANADLVGGQELMATQEIIELYIHKLRMPRRAIPELKRLRERFPGTPAAEAAERELTDIQEMLVREQEGGEPFELQYLRKIDRALAPKTVKLEEQAVRDALEESGGNRAKAAERLGVSIDRLARKMREFGL